MSDEMDALPVAVAGLGEVGGRLVAAVAADPALALVGAADPAYAGSSLAELCGHPGLRGRVAASVDELLARLDGGVLLVATRSRLTDVAPVLRAAAARGVDVVASCEELAWPWLADPELAAELDEAFARRGARAVGTGVNPGFVLDRLPALLATVAGPVHRVLARRVVDLTGRRPALQRKLGAGLTPEAFEAASAKASVGHVGLAESAALVAEAIGVEADEVDETLEPLLAEEAFETEAVSGPAGSVAGTRQVASAYVEGREVIRLELDMYVGAEDPIDEIVLEADSPIRVTIPGGLAGDQATLRAILSAAKVIQSAPSGLLTVLDLPLVGGRA